MITYDVKLCIGTDNPNKRISVKCHDTGVNFRVHLQVCKHGKWMDEIQPYSIPDGSTAVLHIVKPDKKYCIIDGKIDGNTILFDMKPHPQAFTVAGVSKADVSLYNADGNRISSATFNIDVPEECICGCDLESENYIDVMSKQIRTAIEAANRAEEEANRAEKAAKEAGKSAYILALENGFEGTLEEWLASLKGEPGKPGPKGDKGDDYVLTDADKQEITGRVLSAEEIKQIQSDIADLKYVAIKVTSITNNCGTKEMGAVVNEITVSWTLNKEPVNQTLEGEAVDASARSKTFTGLELIANKAFALLVTDERGATDKASTSISFLNGVYYGVLEDGAEVDSAAILTLTRKLQGSRGITFTADAGATQQIVYAIPTRYGTPNFNVGGFDGGFAMAKTFDFTNASGYTETYDVWLSENVGLGSTTVKVS